MHLRPAVHCATGLNKYVSKLYLSYFRGAMNIEQVEFTISYERNLIKQNLSQNYVLIHLMKLQQVRTKYKLQYINLPVQKCLTQPFSKLIRNLKMFRHVQTKYKLKMPYPKLSDVLQNKDDCQYFRRSFLHIFNYTLQIFSRQIQGRFTLYGPWSNL